MTKDCNGCFGASFNDCQRCQMTDKQPPKLDITPELAIAAYNTLIDYCKQFDSASNCGNCIFDQIQYLESRDKIILPSLDGNTVTYIKDGQIKRITCSRKEEAQELFEEVKGRRGRNQNQK